MVISMNSDNLDNPDKDIEFFWFNFKSSMNNYFKSINQTSHHIYLWSEYLNMLQSQKEYQQIEIRIREYMSQYAITLMKAGNCYHMGILITNIKRWNIISHNYNFESDKYYNIIFVLIDIYKTLKNETRDFLDEIFSNPLELIENNYYKLIDIAVKKNKPSILEKLSQYLTHQEVNKLLNQQFNLKLNDHKISFKKVLKNINLQ